MPLTIGCWTKGDTAFEKLHNCSVTTNHEESTVILTSNTLGQILLCKMPNDCTAASVVTEFCSFNNWIKWIPIVLEYLSVNARISCFFSRKVYKDELNYSLNELKKFPIMGLHIQKSNRDPNEETYMITGILKVPNAYIKSYNKWAGEDYSKHNHLDTTKFNELNQQYHLPTL